MAKSQINFGELGGGGVNPTIIQSWNQTAGISYEQTIDPSKTYLVIIVYKSIDTYDATIVIKDGEMTFLSGTDYDIVNVPNKTTIQIAVQSLSNKKYIVFMQLD